MFSTGSVKNNGFNPVWQEELCIPFDCVGGMMDVIFVKFAIKQEKKKLKDEVDEEPIAIYCCSLGALEHGWSRFSSRCTRKLIKANRFPLPAVA